MNKELVRNIGTVDQDNLIAKAEPAAFTFGVVIRKLDAAATLKRGTVLAKSSGTAGDGKMVILGTTAATNETLSPHCILADDVEVGTTADATGVAYRSGNFNRDAVIVKSDTTLTAAHEDELRKVDIIFTDMM